MLAKISMQVGTKQLIQTPGNMWVTALAVVSPNK